MNKIRLESVKDLLKHPLLAGTIFLTLAGLLVRVIGFFYRIYLSRLIGAEGMGLYQLVFPVFGIAFSLCSATIQTGISKFVSEEEVKERGRGISYFYSGLFLSLLLSLLIAFIFYIGSDFIAVKILLDGNCSLLLRILAFTIPITSVHSAINGFFLGKKNASVSGFAQLIEQLVRVFSVMLIVTVMQDKGLAVGAPVAVFGLAAGEAAACIFSILCYGFRKREKTKPDKRLKTLRSSGRQLVKYSVPLTANRLILSVLQSAEAILLPGMLELSGMARSDALSIYGIFTGMAIPFLMFPTAVTSSLATMLLPHVSEAQGRGDTRKIIAVGSLTIEYCLYIGVAATGVFLMFGNGLGNIVFNEPQAGQYLMILSWLCPFIYLTSTAASILNGMGATGTTFVHNLAGIFLRIAFTVFLVPRLGMKAYLYGLLVSQLLITCLHILTLHRQVTLRMDFGHEILRPVSAFALSYYIIMAVYRQIAGQRTPDTLPAIVLIIAVIGIGYLFLLYITRRKELKTQAS